VIHPKNRTSRDPKLSSSILILKPDVQHAIQQNRTSRDPNRYWKGPDRTQALCVVKESLSPIHAGGLDRSYLGCPPKPSLTRWLRLSSCSLRTIYIDIGNYRSGGFEYSIRRFRIFEKTKNRFEIDSCEFEFELPFCDSIRANLLRENSFMNYSRKRSNIREQFVGIRCHVGLLV
jgi:hypothetical protein